MTNVRHRTFGSYSGPQIIGSHRFPFDNSSSGHWERVLYLTSLVESGAKFGSITMYDGTAVTAGLHQAVAVYPKELASEDFYAENDQGALWSLLRKFELVPQLTPYSDLSSLLRENNWYISQDGYLRYLEDCSIKISNRRLLITAGSKVFGADIRDRLTPLGGKVPRTGPRWDQSAKWAVCFHKLFSDPKTFDSQIEFGSSHFLNLANSRRLKEVTVNELLYEADTITPSYDLSLAVFWSHSVNSPYTAFRILSSCTDQIDNPSKNQHAFSKLLLRRLAESTYGRWHWSIRNGRWSRTRRFASTIWESSLFDKKGIMPSSL